MDNNELLLDALSRILRLEKEVEKLNQVIDNMSRAQTSSNEQISINSVMTGNSQPSTATRDKTKYFFNNKRLTKNRLVLAVVTKYVSDNADLTVQQLKTEFDKSLQGSIGVVEDYEIAQKRKDYAVRFFVNEDELIHLTDGIACVCSQWGVLNLPNFLKKAKKLGYHIEKIIAEN